jgi:hypothetical protein
MRQSNLLLATVLLSWACIPAQPQNPWVLAGSGASPTPPQAASGGGSTVTLPSSGSSQSPASSSTGFPAWPIVWLKTKWADRPRVFHHPVLDRVTATDRDSLRRTIRVELGYVVDPMGDSFIWTLLGACNEGTLAVYKSYSGFSGIPTSHSGVLSMDRADISSFTTGFPKSAIMVGVDDDSTTSVSVIVTDGATQPTANHVLQLPIHSSPGEVFVAAGVVGDSVFVQDGANSRIYRYFDGNGDGLPEARDPVVYIHPPSDGPLRVFQGFRADPRPEVLARLLDCADDEIATSFFALVVTGGGIIEMRLIDAAGVPPPGPAAPVLMHVPAAGTERVYCRGASPSAFVQVLVSAAETGPFTALGPTFQADGPTISAALGVPFAPGSWIKLQDPASGATTEARPVLTTGTVAVYKVPWSITSGGVFTLEGQNLDRVTDVQAMWTTLDPDGHLSRSAQPLPIQSQAAEVLTLQAPTTATPLRIDLSLRETLSGTVTQGLVVSVELTP